MTTSIQRKDGTKSLLGTMSMFNDIEWHKRGNEDVYIRNAKHPIFVSTEPLVRGEVKVVKGKQTFFFQATAHNKMFISRTILTCSQLCILPQCVLNTEGNNSGVAQQSICVIPNQNVPDLLSEEITFLAHGGDIRVRGDAV